MVEESNVPTCFVLAGLAGSSLHTVLGPIDTVWVNYSALAFGRIGELRLAADGVAPGLPDGAALTPGVLLDDYYGPCVRVLQRDLGDIGYDVRPWAYDWRKSARLTGVALAAEVRARVTSADPCAIVAHSFGGLVARVCWSELVATGDTALVRRLVTLGTPHGGSYGVVALWCRDSDQLLQMSLLAAPAQYLYGQVNPAALLDFWTPAKLIRVSASWHSFYETLPSLRTSESLQDPLRPDIYAHQWPGELGIRFDRLADATSVWQLRLQDADTIPPPAVLTCVAGVGLSTVHQLRTPRLLGISSCYNTGDDGDGLVTRASALLPGAAHVTIASTHTDLPNAVASSGQLVRLVLDPRHNPAPTPLLQQIPGPLIHILSGPPAPTGFQVIHDC